MPPKPRGRPPKERSMVEFEEILMREGLKEGRRVERERRRIEAAIAAEQAERQARRDDVLPLPPARPQVDTREEARLRASVSAARMSRYGTTQQEVERLAFFKSPSILPALTALADQTSQPSAGGAIMEATFAAAVKDRVRKDKQMSLLQPKRDISARVSASEMPELTSRKSRERGLFLGGVDRPARDRRVLPLTTKVGETNSMFEKVKNLSLFPNIYSM